MRKLLIPAFNLLMVTAASGQQTLPLSHVLEIIESNNPLLQSYQNKIKADSSLVNSAGAWPAPAVGIEFDQNPYSFDNFYTGVVRTSLMQDFPSRKVIDAGKNYLESLSEIDANESRYQRNKLFSQAKEAYNGIYITQKKIQLINQSINTLKSMIGLSEKQMMTGGADLAPIFTLKARLAESETMLVHEENMIKVYMVTLNYLMNADVNQVFFIDTANVIKDYRNLIFLSAMDSIEYWRSDIMQMNSMINSMTLKRDLMALSSRPTLGMKVEQFSIANRPDMFSFMGTMKIPFAPWSAKGYKSEVQAMKFNIASMEQEKQNMVNMTLQMIIMLVLEMNSEYQELDNYTKKVIPSYKKSFDAYLLAYGQNTSDLFPVLMAFDDLQMSQMEYIRHLGVLLKVQVDYEKEMQIR